MAIKIPRYQLTSPPLHFDEDGDKCTGNFIFTNTRSLDDPSTRRCDRCHRNETYDKNYVFAVAKPGISKAVLIEWCSALIRKAQEGIQKTDPQQSVRIFSDRSNSERHVARLFILNIGNVADAGKAIKDLAVSANQDPDLISDVWRKPLAVRYDKTIPYTGAQTK